MSQLLLLLLLLLLHRCCFFELAHVFLHLLPGPALLDGDSQKCDGFMVASTKTDEKLGTVNIQHEGEEEYNNIWQKVRSMWAYVSLSSVKGIVVR